MLPLKVSTSMNSFFLLRIITKICCKFGSVIQKKERKFWFKEIGNVTGKRGGIPDFPCRIAQLIQRGFVDAVNYFSTERKNIRIGTWDWSELFAVYSAKFSFQNIWRSGWKINYIKQPLSLSLSSFSNPFQFKCFQFATMKKSCFSKFEEMNEDDWMLKSSHTSMSHITKTLSTKLGIIN